MNNPEMNSEATFTLETLKQVDSDLLQDEIKEKLSVGNFGCIFKTKLSSVEGAAKAVVQQTFEEKYNSCFNEIVKAVGLHNQLCVPSIGWSKDSGGVYSLILNYMDNGSCAKLFPRVVEHNYAAGVDVWPVKSNILFQVVDAVSFLSGTFSKKSWKLNFESKHVLLNHQLHAKLNLLGMISVRSIPALKEERMKKSEGALTDETREGGKCEVDLSSYKAFTWEMVCDFTSKYKDEEKLNDNDLVNSRPQRVVELLDQLWSCLQSREATFKGQCNSNLYI